MAVPIIAALKGLAALPKLVDSVSMLCDRLGALEKQINEKQVIERMGEKRRRNIAAIRSALERVSPPEDRPGGGAD